MYHGAVKIIHGMVVEKYGGDPIGHIVGRNGELIAEQALEGQPTTAGTGTPFWRIGKKASAAVQVRSQAFKSREDSGLASNSGVVNIISNGTLPGGERPPD